MCEPRRWDQDKGILCSPLPPTHGRAHCGLAMIAAPLQGPRPKAENVAVVCNSSASSGSSWSSESAAWPNGATSASSSSSSCPPPPTAAAAASVDDPFAGQTRYTPLRTLGQGGWILKACLFCTRFAHTRGLGPGGKYSSCTGPSSIAQRARARRAAPRGRQAASMAAHGRPGATALRGAADVSPCRTDQPPGPLCCLTRSQTCAHTKHRNNRIARLLWLRRARARRRRRHRR